MRLSHLLLLALTIFILFGCDTPTQKHQITVKNPLDRPVADAIVELSQADFNRAFPDAEWGEAAPVIQDATLPYQYLGPDDEPSSMLIALDLVAEEEKKITFNANADPSKVEKRSYAELSHKTGGTWEDRKYLGGDFENVESLRVPDEHTDHSYYIRYEGPGWESDKVGYRFYLDWRNAVDIFGKTTSDMVLAEVGLDGFDSYHEMSDWGMDILKVGSSLGLGSIGKWYKGKAERVAMTDSLYCEVAQNGPLQSMIRTIYYGWKTNGDKLDLTVETSIRAGSRLTHQHLEVSEPIDSLCTGIVKHENAEVMMLEGSSWSCLATWGKQSLNDDMLGMAVIYRNADLLEVTEDEHSEIVIFKPVETSVDYYFLAAWEKEPDGITNKAAFEAYLAETLERLSQPVQVNL